MKKQQIMKFKLKRGIIVKKPEFYLSYKQTKHKKKQVNIAMRTEHVLEGRHISAVSSKQPLESQQERTQKIFKMAEGGPWDFESFGEQKVVIKLEEWVKTFIIDNVKLIPKKCRPFLN